jgi:hypothetical protein
MIDDIDANGAIVGYRTRVVEAIRAQFPDFVTVDWYDGLFDEDDVRQWGGGAPACYVAVLNVPTTHHTTGETNGNVRVVCAVITADRDYPRQHDPENYRFLEGIHTFANLNKFGDPNAGAATNGSFKRLRHPQMRREGIGIGVVEWESNLTFGVNTALERDSIRDEDGALIPMPKDMDAQMRDYLGYSETYTFDPEE